MNPLEPFGPLWKENWLYVITSIRHSKQGGNVIVADSRQSISHFGCRLISSLLGLPDLGTTPEPLTCDGLYGQKSTFKHSNTCKHKEENY